MAKVSVRKQKKPSANKKARPPRPITRIKFFGIGELARTRGGYELRIYRDRAEAAALAATSWAEGEMPMGRGCWSEWSEKDPKTGKVTVTCGKFKDVCAAGCEIWESVLTDGAFKWRRTGKDEITTDKPGRFICGCKDQTI